MTNRVRHAATGNSVAFLGKFSLFCTTALAATICLASPVQAQDQGKPADAAETDEIVVTALKRSENLLDTPVAISAFSTDSLKSLNAATLADVGKYVPNLNISRYGVGNTAQAAVFIRAIGLQDHLITTDPGVGVYLDGVYLGRQLGSNLSLSNIERIEVLRGPQGTLYGRNTLGGAVNIITSKPGSDEGTEIQAQVGTRGRINGSFYTDTRLSPTLAVSLNGSYERRNGVGTAVNIPNPSASIGEQNDASGRAAAYWTPTENFSILASVDFVRARDGQSPYKVDIYDEGNPISSSELVSPDDSGTSVPGLETTSLDLFGASVTAELKLDDHLSTKLLNSYRQTKYTGGLADNDTPALISIFPEQGEAKQYSSELQLNGEYGAFNFVGGLYYFHENGTNQSSPAFFFGGFSDYYIKQVSNSYAAYANANLNLGEKLTIGAGVRYSHDKKTATADFASFPAPVTRSATYEAVTAQGNISYKLAENVNVYGTIQLGYQPGSFTPRPFGGPSSFNASPKTTATNYEVGFKGKILPNWTLLLSGFITEYGDRGLPYSFINANGFNTVIISADARAKGVEAETTITLGGLRLKGSLGYLDSKITSVNSLPPAFFPTGGTPVAGAPTALSPDVTGSAVASYAFDLPSGGTITPQVDYSYRAKEYGQPVARASELLAARNLVGFNLKYENAARTMSFAVYGNNIFNKVYDTGRLDQGGFVGVVRSNDRSEFGVRFTRKFGG
ncbi:TonB-dependent receptor [Sphingopyxis sp. SE2]|uniref:TonB-dependent receptor n=1 Tax=Sphingopyxis sp. SE2 TaxID=1586240 RepID=UPI0028C32B39|nr:TonB-dependent receptor [Sphingopyxis sp. SE2]MDT7531628.1 TonB-dependent receptor [Sphingopyxis sp. SE2]